jgi:hypothetical protein
MDWSDDNDLTEESESVHVCRDDDEDDARGRAGKLLLACSRDNELSESL